MQPSLILFIDDNQTVRKVVEGYLSQEGHRVLLAADAERGLELARTSRPNLILLDHQLPGTTGDQIVRRLLESEETAEIPVVICSAMRNKAFVSYADFPNVVDQIPKPFTAEMLKGGVSNALQTGALVVRAQRNGSAMPESIDHQFDPVLQGTTSVFPLRTLFDFLNNGRHEGRLILEAGRDRIYFALSGGRIQAVYSPTISPGQLGAQLPEDLADLAPLLAVTLAERQDAQVSGLIGLLERSLTDPRRPRALLRFQAGVLTYRALTEDSGPFVFTPSSELPPVFRAFPLQMSLPALAVEGVRRCNPVIDINSWAGLVFRRPAIPGANTDRAGLSTVASKIHSSLDGLRDLETLAREFGLGLADVVNLIQGLELIGLVERRSDDILVLVLEDDPTTIEVIKQALQEKSLRCQFKIVQERVAAQLLMKRARFDIIMLALDRPDQEQFYSSIRAQSPPTTRFVGLTRFSDEAELLRLDSLGLDGIIERPVDAKAVQETIRLLVDSSSLSRAS
jgi:CheY-like chemotaxis protein